MLYNLQVIGQNVEILNNRLMSSELGKNIYKFDIIISKFDINRVHVSEFLRSTVRV